MMNLLVNDEFNTSDWPGEVMLCVCLIFMLLPTTATTRPTPVKLLLVIDSREFVHDVVKRESGPSRVERTFDRLSQRNGLFTFETITDITHLTPQKLDAARLIVFYTTGELPFTDDQYEAFERWIRDGGGFLAIHCAADTLKNHPRYPKLVGGTFDGHPWEADSTVTLKVHDPDWAACQPFGREITLQEETYQFSNFDPASVRVLISLDMEKTALKKPLHIPIAWCKDFGRGRVFYTELGHREDVWTNAKYQAHLLGAIKWLLEIDPHEATPNPELSAREEKLARDAAR